MSNEKTLSDKISLDEFGRVILGDEDLEAMAAEAHIVQAGAGNTVCSGQNASCGNSWCGGTTNSGACSNSVYCGGSRNEIGCTPVKGNNNMCTC